MIRIVSILWIFGWITFNLGAQTSSIKGVLVDNTDAAVIYSNLILSTSVDSQIVKIETSDLDGMFVFNNIPVGNYILKASYVGYEDLIVDNIILTEETLDLTTLQFTTAGIALETAIVTARRALVEIKPDRTVFNVQGTINSAGDNGLSLLRKAPGVLVDNNNNISVLSRSGVLIYVDGKRLPLSGDDLSSYLESLPAEQIDRIDIITNPGAKYEAQGNAGIIDIRLKKDKNLGSNGSISANIGKGQRTRGNINSSGNYRNKRLNSFGSLGYQNNRSWNEMSFDNYQNSFVLKETDLQLADRVNYNYRWGTDFFISENATIGFLIGGNNTEGVNNSTNRVKISALSTQNTVDSILVANNVIESNNKQRTYNINYAYRKAETTLNMDVDYGSYTNLQDFIQPNEYYNADESELLSQTNTAFDTPVQIDIYTAKIDYETPLGGGKLGVGSKLSKVATDNTFLYFNVVDDVRLRNDQRSNLFKYDENVYAAYTNYQRSLSKAWSMTAGLRVEITDAVGDLTTFDPTLQEDPVNLDYTDFFPTAGVTYAMNSSNMFSLNYGKRINRPDYNVLNPFRTQLSELSFSKGNESLRPEIVNNIELGYTLNYRYNFKLSYSKTLDQITRLIGPDELNPRASFIGWDNLAEQTVYGLNVTAPVQFTSIWNAFFNLGGSYINNQADYGEGAVVDVQAWTYNIYQQHTINLPQGFTGEVSGWYSGPGVWGGVFKYNPTWSLNFGLQRKFFNDNMNVRLSVQDVFFQSGWEGASEFNGLRSEGMGNWDSRRANISVSYNFGNNNVKSRKRKTGIESEESRVGQ